MMERVFWVVALFWVLPEYVVFDGLYERGQETVPFFRIVCLMRLMPCRLGPIVWMAIGSFYLWVRKSHF